MGKQIKEKKKKEKKMIITFGTQKGGTGKTTLAIAFANYLSIQYKKKVNVFDFDFQKSLHEKWDDDKNLPEEKIYDVEILEESPFEDMQDIIDWTESDELYLVDLAGTLDSNYTDLLMYSNYVVIPFEYSDVSIKSTLKFIYILANMGSEAEMIFIRSRYDKSFNYPNQEAMDELIAKYGTIINTPVYKRNALQNINTRYLNYHQKKAVEKPLEELIQKINLKV